MFGIIRIIIGFITFFLCHTLLLKKSSKSSNRKKFLVPFFISIIVTTALAFIPFENLFLSFETPEESYKYVNPGVSNIKLVVNGNNNDLVIGEENNSDIYLIIPKTSSGWKVGVGTNTKRIAQKISNDVIIYVYQYRNENDYFIAVHNPKNKNIYLTDIYNSEFIVPKRTDSSIDIHYTNIQNFDSGYWISVNGEKITVLE